MLWQIVFVGKEFKFVGIAPMELYSRPQILSNLLTSIHSFYLSLYYILTTSCFVDMGIRTFTRSDGCFSAIKTCNDGFLAVSKNYRDEFYGVARA